MGKHKKRQEALWVPTSDLPRSPGHPFYSRLNRALESEGFDRFVESRCRRFYAAVLGRPSLAPGRYFRLLLVGTSRAWTPSVGWRGVQRTRLGCGASWGLGWRSGPRDDLADPAAIDLETHPCSPGSKSAWRGRVFSIAIDATTLEANAAMRSIRDTGDYQEFLKPRRRAFARPLGNAGAAGSAAQEERLERGMEESGGSGREDRPK